MQKRVVLVVLVQMLLPIPAFNARTKLSTLQFFVGHWQGTVHGEPDEGHSKNKCGSHNQSSLFASPSCSAPVEPTTITQCKKVDELCQRKVEMSCFLPY